MINFATFCGQISSHTTMVYMLTGESPHGNSQIKSLQQSSITLHLALPGKTRVLEVDGSETELAIAMCHY